jgi:hypothetical protein
LLKVALNTIKPRIKMEGTFRYICKSIKLEQHGCI